MKHTFSWNKTVATAKGMQEADIPTSAIARFTKNRWSWFLMERFQNTTRHTEMLPRIPINVVMPSKIPMIITIPDSGILYRGNAVVNWWSCEPNGQPNEACNTICYDSLFVVKFHPVSKGQSFTACASGSLCSLTHVTTRSWSIAPKTQVLTFHAEVG